MTTVAITMGCPTGIGPEIILRSLEKKSWGPGVSPVILGDINILSKCAAELNIENPCVTWQPGTKPADNTTPVVQLSNLDAGTVAWGKPNISTAHAMAKYIETAVRFSQQGIVDAITTCPISKDALNQAGYKFPGHTEMLADLTDTRQYRYAMMMAGKKLKVTLVTIHCPLAKVAELLSIEAIYSLIVTTFNALKIDFNLDSPKIGVAGLNPHGGENNLFGCEEETLLIPAIRRAEGMGIKVIGPLPPDTIFFKAAQGDFDAVVCMYHDQGLIPFKLLHFYDGVNVTLGLPVVRTSVDHGTAYDIAGKGIAHPDSLIEAVNMAAKISRNRTILPKNPLKVKKDG